MKKKLTLVLAIAFMLCFSTQVYARDVNTYSSGSLYDCAIFVSIASNGIRVTYETNTTITATEIGCKDIVLQEKVDGSWRDLKISGGKTSNSSYYGGNTVYTKAVKGRSYRAHCTHYANLNGTVKTLYNECDSIVYN